MRADVKASWLEALRSGAYKQGSVFLNGPDGFCCLGVLTNLAVQDGVGEWVDRKLPGSDEVGVKNHMIENVPSTAMLSSGVQEWAGLIGCDRYGDYGRGNSLANRNDHGEPFAQIADVIEADIKGV